MPEKITKEALKLAGLTQAAVAQRVGLTKTQMSLSLKGERRFQVHEMDAIREMLAEARGKAEAAELAGPDEMPIIAQVQAGNWREAVAHAIGTFPRFDPDIPEVAFGLRVKGDSMDKVTKEGTIVVVDPSDKQLFRKGYYVVLNADGEATFKQYFDDPARLEPCSTNPAHTAIILGSGEQYEIVGRVRWGGFRL